jgi:hypothetical protein
MLEPLTGAYPSRYGAPVLTHVETAIFTARYFTRCMSCDFCGDACCRHGVDIDLDNVRRLEARAEEIEAFTGVPRARWFTDEVEADVDHPGGVAHRTAADERGCVFLDRSGRGCMLHKLAVARGLDYHDLKPMVSALFPLTFGSGALTIADEVEDRTLVCLDVGDSIYRGGRDEIAYYFGAALVAELDALERRITP